jgi:hypothetical protein
MPGVNSCHGGEEDDEFAMVPQDTEVMKKITDLDVEIFLVHYCLCNHEAHHHQISILLFLDH